MNIFDSHIPQSDSVKHGGLSSRIGIDRGHHTRPPRPDKSLRARLRRLFRRDH